MFLHNKQLQYPVRVDQPDPLMATRVQEILINEPPSEPPLDHLAPSLPALACLRQAQGA